MQKKHLIIGLSLVLVIVLAVLVKNDQRKNEKRALEYENKASDPASLTKLPPIEKTNDIDSLVNGVIADYALDANIISENDTDTQYILDSAALINPEGVYNENEL